MKLKGISRAQILILVLLLGLPLVGFAVRPVSAATSYSNYSVSFTSFHNSLSPYGSWVNVSNYGPCWRPARLTTGWRPYYANGHWAYTEYGWTWVSNEPWGSIVYHYGSWVYDPSNGWVWVPGYSWAPSWVTWMYTDDYVGWAPIPPTFRFAANRVVTYDPVVVSYTNYIFVPANRFTAVNVSSVCVPFARNAEIVRIARPVTTINVVNNHIINRGPDTVVVDRFRRSQVRLEQVSGSRVRPQPVRLSGNQSFIEATSPQVNRVEGNRIIKDIDRSRLGDQADRDRRIRREQAVQPGAPRKQAGELRQEQRRQQNESERMQRQQQQQQQHEQRRQLNESERMQRQQQREQSRQQNESERMQRQQQQQQQQQHEQRRMESRQMMPQGNVEHRQRRQH